VQDSQVEIQYKRPFTIVLVDEAVDCQGSARLQKIVIGSGDGLFPDTDMLIKAAFDAGLGVSRAALDTQAADCRMNSCEAHDRWTAVFHDERLIAIEPGDTSAALYAVAVDLGTNTLEVSLIDALHGRKIAVVTDSNPQIELGDTYEARLAMVEEDALNLEILNEEIILRIDILIYELCVACDVSPQQVYEILVAGATGMLHLFLMRAPAPLAQHATGDSVSARCTAGQLDIRSTAQAGIALMPVISSYAGADITAAILATRLHRSDETTLLLDLGGSTKAVLYHQGRLFVSVSGCTSVLDGAGLSCGMRPESGAINGVHLDDAGDLTVAVIGESLARGLCGSGLLELVACLRETGMLDSCGNFMQGADGCGELLKKRVIMVDGESAFVLFSDEGEFLTDIYVTRQDIFKLIQARVHVAAMLDHLCAQVGIPFGDICRVLVSGALGGPLKGHVLSTLGFVPAVLTEQIVFIGNASKQGLQLALLDKAIADEAGELARVVVSIPCPDNDTPLYALHF
jgi:uncharacterized 2Fe-2S/4Fe-4S cluster protein (DUF4445 family)